MPRRLQNCPNVPQTIPQLPLAPCSAEGLTRNSRRRICFDTGTLADNRKRPYSGSTRPDKNPLLAADKAVTYGCPAQKETVYDALFRDRIPLFEAAVGCWLA